MHLHDNAGVLKTRLKRHASPVSGQAQLEL